MTTEERFEKIETAIRDLIVVSRTISTAVDELREGHKQIELNFGALIQAQRETEVKVSRLVETVDKLVRYRGPNGQPGAM